MSMCELEIGYGPELYSEIFRLICEWNGSDAADRTNKLPELVSDLARLHVRLSVEAASVAAYDHAEAA